MGEAAQGVAVTHRILTDTGPLVALVNRRDPNHFRCLEASRVLPRGPLLTTWPCFTEAMYLVHRAGGYQGQAALFALRSSGRLLLYDLTDEETDRIDSLMQRYRDTPMDLADASLVAVAESLGNQRIFTLDRRHFSVYRLANGLGLELVP